MIGEILGVVGSIASIISLGSDGIIAYKNNNNNKNAEILGSLKSIESTIKLWKELHTKYHSSGGVFRAINEIIHNREGTSLIIKRKVEEIEIKELQRIFSNPSFSQFIKELDRERYENRIEVLISNFEEIKIEVFKNLRKLKQSEWCNKLEMLIEAENRILSTHRKFISFLKAISHERECSTWSNYQVNMILSNEYLFYTEYEMLIQDTDFVLMSILDIQLFIYDSIED